MKARDPLHEMTVWDTLTRLSTLGGKGQEEALARVCLPKPSATLNRRSPFGAWINGYFIIRQTYS